MARGRLISKSLGSSRKFHLLGKQANGLGEFAQALFIMLVTHTDDFGRMPADAFTVKHAVWPASPRSEAQFEKALRHMHEARLVTLYDVNGDKFLEINDFDTHQPNLHKRTASKFPEIPGTPGNSGLARARGIESNLTESNLTESNPEPADASVALAIIDDGFERFWDAYPKKVGKGEARKSWTKLRLSDSRAEALIDSVGRQRRSAQWTREGGRFIPNPATWLNQQRWDDQPDPDVPQLSDRNLANLSGGEAFLRGDYDRK